MNPYTAILKRFWWAIPIAGLFIALMLTRSTLDDVKGQRDAEKAAHAQTVANYRAAAVEAQRRDLANVVRVKEEQERISNAEVEKVLARAADSDARYQRLLATAKAYSSRPATDGVPETSDATCRAYAGTDCDGIPALLKAAQDNTDRLVGLQAWVKAQATVITTPPE